MAAQREERSLPTQQNNKLTWAAAVAAVILAVPGLAVGQVAAAVYAWFLGLLVSHFPYIVEVIVIDFFGQLIAGAIAGVIALRLACFIFKRANKTAVFYTLTTAVIFLTALSLVLPFAGEFVHNFVGIIASGLGTIIGARVVSRMGDGTRV